MPELDVPLGGASDFCAVLILQDECEVVIHEFSCVVVEALMPFVGLAGVDKPGLLRFAAFVADAIVVGLIGGDFDVDGLTGGWGTCSVGFILDILQTVMTTPAC